MNGRRAAGVLGATLTAALAVAAAAAQESAPLALGEAERLAYAADPRLRQLDLERAASELRLATIAAERLPAITVGAEAQAQSESVEIPFDPPGAAAPPEAPTETMDAHVRLERALVDPTREARIAAERARLAEAEARIETAVSRLRREVDEAFFAAILLQEREARLAAAVEDLEARLREARLRVDEGVALPGEAAAVEAELLRLRQEAAELAAGRRAALERLGLLVGRPLGTAEALVLPDLGAAVADASARLDTLRERPELAEIARARERLAAEQALVAAEERPRLSAFARAGVGNPGLNFLDDSWNPYWLAGVRLSWTPWSWGGNERRREELELRREALAADQEALVRSIRRSVSGDLATIDRLREAAALDERIVALREAIERETRARYEERVVTAAVYVDARTDLLDARLAAAGRQVELAQAEARLLAKLGLEVP